MHADALVYEDGDPVAIGHPEGDVVKRLRPHPRQDNDALLPGVDRSPQLLLVYSSGGFWTLCSVAYSSVSLLITSAPSP